MRHFTQKSGSKLPGLRSNHNGPIQRKMFPTSELYSGKVLSLPYTAAKPYTWCEYNLVSSPDPLLVQTMGFKVPTVEQLLESVLEDVPTFLSSLFKDVIDDRYAVNGALENAQAYGELLMYVTAMEARDTISMIRNVFIRLWNVFKDLLRSVKKLNLVATIDVLADLWLEYRYGWRPLAGEIGSIVETLNRAKISGVQSSYGTFKGKPLSTNPIQRQIDLSMDGKTTNWLFSATPKSEYTVKTGFNYINKVGSRNEDFMAIWGLDWQSLASTVWESVPFSFVVDMFLNIGSLLQARDVHDQVSSFNGYMTCTGKFDVTLTPSNEVIHREVLLWDFLTYSDQKLVEQSEAFAALYNLFNSRVKSALVNDDGSYPRFKRWWLNRYDKRGWGDTLEEALARQLTKNRLPSLSELQADGPSLWTIPTGSNIRHTRLLTDLGILEAPSLVYQHFGVDKEDPEVKRLGYDYPFFNHPDGRLTLNQAILRLHAAWNRLCKRCYKVKQIILSGREPKKGHKFVDYKQVEIWYWPSGHLESDVVSYFSYADVDSDGDELSEEERDLLSYKLELRLVQRFLRSDFHHTFIADTDLSSGQYADLGALGWNLVKSLTK